MCIEPRIQGRRAAFGRADDKEIDPLQRVLVVLTHALVLFCPPRMASQTDNPNRRFTATAAATFHRAMLKAVATAAPSIPNRGIAHTFKAKLPERRNPQDALRRTLVPGHVEQVHHRSAQGVHHLTHGQPHQAVRSDHKGVSKPAHPPRRNRHQSHKGRNAEGHVEEGRLAQGRLQPCAVPRGMTLGKQGRGIAVDRRLHQRHHRRHAKRDAVNPHLVFFQEMAQQQRVGPTHDEKHGRARATWANPSASWASIPTLTTTASADSRQRLGSAMDSSTTPSKALATKRRGIGRDNAPSQAHHAGHCTRGDDAWLEQSITLHSRQAAQRLRGHAPHGQNGTHCDPRPRLGQRRGRPNHDVSNGSSSPRRRRQQGAASSPVTSITRPTRRLCTRVLALHLGRCHPLHEHAIQAQSRRQRCDGQDRQRQFKTAIGRGSFVPDSPTMRGVRRGRAKQLDGQHETRSAEEFGRGGPRLKGRCRSFRCMSLRQVLESRASNSLRVNRGRCKTSETPTAVQIASSRSDHPQSVVQPHWGARPQRCRPQIGDPHGQPSPIAITEARHASQLLVKYVRGSHVPALHACAPFADAAPRCGDLPGPGLGAKPRDLDVQRTYPGHATLHAQWDDTMRPNTLPYVPSVSTNAMLA